MSPADYAQLRRNVQLSEGLRLKPYTDVAGRLSIGWGRNLTDCGISQVEAGMLLDNSLTTAVSDLQQAFPFVLDLDSVRLVVLAEMCYNLGISRLAKFTKMWALIRSKQYSQAAIEMLDSEWASQVGARATRLADAMSKGSFE